LVAFPDPHKINTEYRSKILPVFLPVLPMKSIIGTSTVPYRYGSQLSCDHWYLIPSCPVWRVRGCPAGTWTLNCSWHPTLSLEHIAAPSQPTNSLPVLLANITNLCTQRVYRYISCNNDSHTTAAGRFTILSQSHKN
jgi:hypothetical protein